MTFGKIFPDNRRNGIRPDLIAFGLGMKIVVHHLRADGSIRFQKFLAEVDVEDLVAVGKT